MEYEGKELTALAVACTDLSIQPPTLIAVDRFRWTFEDTPGLGPKMIQLERKLQAMLNRPIDLRLESEKDKNKRVERTGRSEKE